MRNCYRNIFCLLLAVLALTAPAVLGQDNWTATLNFDPFPSPYISDWENNPSIGQAFITNGTSATVTVRVYLTLVHETRGKLASANSRPFEFPPGQPTSLTTRDLIDDQSVEYDQSIRELSVRTGRLPEGKYQICLRLETESGQLLLDNQCAEFTILYPDPPYLVYPIDGERIIDPYPSLQWTPVQVPVGFQVHYGLVIAEVLQGQTPAQALAANYPQYRNDNIVSTSLQYPVEALALQKGRSYAWQVQVLDDKGYPPSANNGRSEIWTFVCDIDTMPPVEVRQLAGHVYDNETGQGLGSVRVVYRTVHRAVSGSDTSWVEQDDSLVCLSDASGYFKFDSAIYKSYYSLSASRQDYQASHLVGQAQYLDKEIKNASIRLSPAPPGSRRLAGTVRDFYSNEPVPNISVVYHVVEAKSSSDTSASGRISYVENPRKTIEVVTDAEGRFEITQAADSSFFSLRASKPPAYLPAVEMGPDQRQVGDIDDYILLIKPNAGSISGRLVSSIAGVNYPVPKAIVRLTRSAVLTRVGTIGGIPFNKTEVLTEGTSNSAYSDANGYFKIQRISQEKPTLVETSYFQFFLIRIPIKTTTTYVSYSYHISVDDRRYQPYLSHDSVEVSPGENTDAGEHELSPRTGAIVGRIRTDTVGVEGAEVSLYLSSGGGSGQGGSSGKPSSRSSLNLSPEGGRPLPAFDTTWGNASSQRPTGEPIDFRRTDKTGSYSFPAVPINDPDQQADRYVIWVEADGYNPGSRSNRIGQEKEVDTVNFGLSRVGGILYGQVTGDAGNELSNVRVELLGDDTSGGSSAQTVSAWVASGGDGSYSLADITPGLYRLKFTRSGCNDLVTDTFHVDYGDRFRRDVTLNTAKGFIALKITDKDGKGLSDVCVKSAQIPSLLGFTDREGQILISGAADSVTLQLRKLNYTDVDTTVIVPANDTLRVTRSMAKPVGEIVVRVVEKGATDKKLAGMTVTIGKVEAGSNAKEKLPSKKTNEDGEAEFEDAPVGQQTITVTPPSDSSSDRDFVIAETQALIVTGLNVKPIVVEMAPAARIQGTVKNKDGGSSIEGVTVSIEGNSQVKAVTDASGGFKLRNVPPSDKTKLVAFKCGFRSARYSYDKTIAVGDKVTGIAIELEKSPMDSLFGFPIALDSVKSGANGKNRVWGTLLEVPTTFGMKLKDEASKLSFADVEVDSNYKPTADSLALVQSEVGVNAFGLDGKMSCEGGLCLQWIDSVKAGRISGSVRLDDPISKIFSETKFLDLTIPKKYAPSFWAGGINHGLDRFGLTSTSNEVQVQIKGVKLGLDFTKSNADTAGLHLFGTVYLGSSISIGFEELCIGLDEAGDIALKSVTFKTKPAISIPFGVFTVVDSSLSWEATGFRASGAIVLNALENRTFGFKDLRISPEGEFLSLAVTADEKNGTITVAGQKFQIEKIEFGTENFESKTLEHTKYFAFAGKLSVKALDKPVGVSLRYTEKGLFTGKLDFNQSRSFGGIVTVTLETIELGYDSTKSEQFVGISGGMKFEAIAGLKLQASNLRFYFGGDVSIDKLAVDFTAGPVQVQVSVSYANSVFEGKGLFEVKPFLSAGAEFRYGGTRDWWVRIISGTRIPIGPAEIVQASGGIGRKDDVWKFSIGGVVAPAKADKGIRLELLVEVQSTPQGVIILGNANVEVGNGTQVGKATLEINIPEKRVNGSIIFAMDFKALTAKAQLDLGVKFGQYWYVFGRANIDVLKFFKNDGIIIVANNWEWQHDGKTMPMSGIYVELNSQFGVNANWYVIKWGVNFDRHAMVYIGWNGDFSGKIDMSGGAYAWIGFGPFDLIQARASMALAAHLSYIEPEWSAGARGNFSLQGSIGWCGNANCWTICWKCFVKIFGHCIFALPTGAKACIGMNAYIDYSTSKGMSWDISF